LALVAGHSKCSVAIYYAQLALAIKTTLQNIIILLLLLPIPVVSQFKA
jgi:hypothetical protein